jgi:hypothetical protein
MAAVATPIFQDDFVSKQSRWQMHAFWGVLAALIASLGINAYLVVMRPVRMGILQTDRYGQPIGLIQPITATGDLPTALVNAFIDQTIQDIMTITSDVAHDEYVYGLILGTPGHAGWAQGDARARLIDFYTGKGTTHDPRQLYLHQTQWTHGANVTKLPEAGWYEATFTLYVQARNDERVTSTDWKMTVKLEWSDVTPTDPYGLYLSQIDLQQEAK